MPGGGVLLSLSEKGGDRETETDGEAHVHFLGENEGYILSHAEGVDWQS
jgi:hypothetical protein